jgi:hypothetical protein
VRATGADELSAQVERVEALDRVERLRRWIGERLDAIRDVEGKAGARAHLIAGGVWADRLEHRAAAAEREHGQIGEQAGAARVVLGAADGHARDEAAPALARHHEHRPLAPPAQRARADDAGELRPRRAERAGRGQVRASLGVDLGGAEEHEVDAAAARVIEQLGDRDLGGAAVEVREVLARSMEARDARVERADAREVGEARRVRRARDGDREHGQRRRDAGRHGVAVGDLAGHLPHEPIRGGDRGGHAAPAWIRPSRTAAIHAAPRPASASSR